MPRLGEVFFDVRGNSRTMRLSWYADTGVAVFSIWQGGTCTGTFRVPITDLPRLVDALQRGPQGASAAAREVPATGPTNVQRYQQDGSEHGGYGQPATPSGSDADRGRHADPGRYGDPLTHGEIGPLPARADHGEFGGQAEPAAYGGYQAPGSLPGRHAPPVPSSYAEPSPQASSYGPSPSAPSPSAPSPSAPSPGGEHGYPEPGGYGYPDPGSYGGQAEVAAQDGYPPLAHDGYPDPDEFVTRADSPTAGAYRDPRYGSYSHAGERGGSVGPGSHGSQGYGDYADPGGYADPGQALPNTVPTSTVPPDPAIFNQAAPPTAPYPPDPAIFNEAAPPTAPYPPDPYLDGPLPDSEQETAPPPPRRRTAPGPRHAPDEAGFRYGYPPHVER